jgi:hypothetical protein
MIKIVSIMPIKDESGSLKENLKINKVSFVGCFTL